MRVAVAVSSRRARLPPAKTRSMLPIVTTSPSVSTATSTRGAVDEGAVDAAVVMDLRAVGRRNQGGVVARSQHLGNDDVVVVGPADLDRARHRVHGRFARPQDLHHRGGDVRRVAADAAGFGIRRPRSRGHLHRLRPVNVRRRLLSGGRGGRQPAGRRARQRTRRGVLHYGSDDGYSAVAPTVSRLRAGGRICRLRSRRARRWLWRLTGPERAGLRTDPGPAAVRSARSAGWRWVSTSSRAAARPNPGGDRPRRSPPDRPDCRC